MKKFIEKLIYDSYGKLPAVLWLCDILLMCFSLLVIATMPFYWDALAIAFGENVPSDVFAIALCSLFGSIIGIPVLDEIDYRRRY